MTNNIMVTEVDRMPVLRWLLQRNPDHAPTRGNMLHVLKCHPAPFHATRAGLKPYEIRRTDAGRDFAVGDVLCLREWIPAGDPDHMLEGDYTGRALLAAVSYISVPGTWDLPRNVCVMGLVGVDAYDPATLNGDWLVAMVNWAESAIGAPARAGQAGPITYAWTPEWAKLQQHRRTPPLQHAARPAMGAKCSAVREPVNNYDEGAHCSLPAGHAGRHVQTTPWREDWDAG